MRYLSNRRVDFNSSIYECKGRTLMLEHDGDGMNLTNESYVITIRGKNSVESYYRDEAGWHKVSARGRKFPATAEQTLNHVLPAVAGIKPNVSIKVEHFDDPGKRVLEGLQGKMAI